MLEIGSIKLDLLLNLTIHVFFSINLSFLTDTCQTQIRWHWYIKFLILNKSVMSQILPVIHVDYTTYIVKATIVTQIKSMFLSILGFVFKILNDSLTTVINFKVIHIVCTVYFFVQRSIHP